MLGPEWFPRGDSKIISRLHQRCFPCRSPWCGDKEMQCAPRTMTSGSLQKTQRGIFCFNHSGSYLHHQVATDFLGSHLCSARVTPLKSGAINWCTRETPKISVNLSDGLWEPNSTGPLKRHGVEEEGAEKEDPLPLHTGSSGSWSLVWGTPPWLPAQLCSHRPSLHPEAHQGLWNERANCWMPASDEITNF